MQIRSYEMRQESVESLLDTLLNSPNDAWRDDAAQDLADCSDNVQAQEALFTAISSLKLDDSLIRTCAESLATIWILSGGVTTANIKRLNGVPRFVVEEYLRAANPGQYWDVEKGS